VSSDVNQSGDAADPTGTHGSDPVGSLAEEAAKLMGALSGWTREHGDGASAWTGIADVFHDHVQTGAPECTWCPVCRTLHAIRQTSPEVRAHLTSAATSLMLAVSGMMATHPPSSEKGNVQRIRLDDEWPEEDE
jgi:hypothetical protein